jgi:hypothetical protein
VLTVAPSDFAVAVAVAVAVAISVTTSDVAAP